MSTKTFADTCGSECLYLTLRVMKPEGTNQSFSDFQKELGKVPKGGYTLANLSDMAQKRGLFAEYLNCDSDELERLLKNRLAILHIKSGNQEHFVLCKKMSDKLASFFDPAGDLKSVSKARLEKIWSGKGLLLSDAPIDLRSVQRNSSIPLLLSISAVVLGALAILWRFKK
jgi:ABC-type bacteriocin/lantibiotic exporter with double-glycine peptidase domain